MTNRVVLVSGPCGSGKSETLRAMRGAIGGRVNEVAVIDADLFHMMFDPHWTVPHPEVEKYYEWTGWLVCKTVQHMRELGVDWIAIASNGLWDEQRARTMVEAIEPGNFVLHHVTLDPGLDVVRARMASRVAAHGDRVDADKTPEWLGSQVEWFRERLGPWTAVIDNASLTPEETARAVFDAVESGEGRLD